jgi:hypothetical protein
MVTTRGTTAHAQWISMKRWLIPNIIQGRKVYFFTRDVVFSTYKQSLRIWDQDKFTAIKRHKKNLNKRYGSLFCDQEVYKFFCESAERIRNTESKKAGLQKNLTKTQDVLSLKL